MSGANFVGSTTSIGPVFKNGLTAPYIQTEQLGRVGQATFNTGTTVSVACPTVNVSSLVMITPASVPPVFGFSSFYTSTATTVSGSSFSIFSRNATETATVNYWVVDRVGGR